MTKFTPERCKAILESISNRIPYALAAEANGIGEETLYGWLRDGLRDQREGIDSEYARFSESLKRIEQEKLKNHLDCIDSMPERWQAQAWILERRWWRYFSPNGALRELAEDVDKMKQSTNQNDLKSIDNKIDNLLNK